MSNPHHYLVGSQRIPGYLPYPQPVAPGNIPVPNASSVDWPQAQFAPPFLPPGSASFQPYVYPHYDASWGDGLALENGKQARRRRRARRAAGKGAIGRLRKIRARRSARRSPECKAAKAELREHTGGIGAFYFKHRQYKAARDSAEGLALVRAKKAACSAGSARSNPAFAVDDKYVWALGGAVLGYMAHRFGWDRKLRALGKRKL